MNLLDRAISSVSPTLGLRRLRARLAIDAVQEFAYDGAKPGRRTGGWERHRTSANAEIRAGMVPLRDGARDLVRNNPLAAKALLELSTKAVGTGILPRARTGVPAIDSILDEKFAEWSDAIGYPQIQLLSARSIVEGGEALLRFRPRLVSDGLPVPFQPQVLEPDWIDNYKTMPLQNGGAIIEGIEFDPIGREVAVWLYRNHPGDAIAGLSFIGSTYQSYRVAFDSGLPTAGYARGYRIDRPGQVRGVSWFAPVMMALYDLGGYETAERVRKRMESCLAMFYSGPDVGDLTPTMGQQSKDAAGRIIEQFSPGMIARLPEGSTVTVAEPKSSGGYAEYVRTQERKIASGLGVPYEILTGDLSQVNYSSYRGGLIGFRGIIEEFQWNTLVPFVCAPVWRRFVDACMIAGIVKVHPGYGVEWGTPKFDLLDRLAEAQADEKQVRIGTMTWPQAVMAQGLDPAKQLQQIQDWNEELDKRGIVVDCDPRRIGRMGMAQKDPAQTDLPPAAA